MNEALRVVMFTLVLAALYQLVQWASAQKWIEPWLPHQEHAGRVSTIDGLRGYLAIGVIFCHIFCFKSVAGGQPWSLYPSHFLELLGDEAVFLFFAITGYLFWSRAIRSEGLIPPVLLYIKRFWRIFPLYFGLLFASIAIAIVTVGLNRFDFGELLKSMPHLLVPGLGVHETVSGFEFHTLVTQTWSLYYEVMFYLLLPVVALVFRRHPLGFVALTVLVGVLFVFGEKWGIVAISTACVNFWIGMVAAEMKARWSLPDWIRSRAVGIGMIVAMLLLVAHLLTRPVAALLFFIPLVYGNNLLGLLDRPTSRLLGDISYSIYIIHMLVIYVVLMPFGATVHNLPELQYWLITLPVCALVCALSLVTYRFLEAPFLKGTPNALTKLAERASSKK